MSMRLPLPADNVPATAYVVAAPCRSDALGGTLRASYPSMDQNEPFADLLNALDRIEYAHTSANDSATLAA
jgi:hypothetical protein